nr:reverse transcriptase domain-containing protein [Tanacetum cinerariifolium]
MKANDAMQTNMTSLINLNLELKNKFGRFMKMNTASSLGLRTLPGNTITNLKEDLKGITTRKGTSYQGPMIPSTFSSSSSVVEHEIEATKDTVHPTNNGSNKDVQPLVVTTKSPILTFEPVNSPIIEPVASPVSAPRPNQRPLIPYPSRLQDQKLRDKANDQQVEVKYLPPHLEYEFLEGDDKFPVIIAKDLSVEEKTALITILKSHKQAIA